MRAVEISKTIQIPDEVELTLDGKKITFKGAKGTLTEDFSHAPIFMEVQGKTFKSLGEVATQKRNGACRNYTCTCKNMIIGVTKGFTQKLKIVFSHFPISVKVQGNNVLIENFTGERNPRRARIIGDVKVKIQSEDIIVQGINLEDVSQTAANIEQATKVRRKDPRVFLDGIYVYERIEGMEQ